VEFRAPVDLDGDPLDGGHSGIVVVGEALGGGGGGGGGASAGASGSVSSSGAALGSGSTAGVAGGASLVLPADVAELDAVVEAHLAASPGLRSPIRTAAGDAAAAAAGGAYTVLSDGPEAGSARLGPNAAATVSSAVASEGVPALSSAKAAADEEEAEEAAWREAESRASSLAALAAAATEALNFSWSNLSLRDRVRFVNGWAVFSLVCDALVAASSCLNLTARMAHIPSEPGHAFLMGMGTALLWLSLLRYMEHERAYFNIVLTLRRAGPRVLRFLVGVLPIFIAYSLFALIMFSDRIPRFCDLRTSFVTLFANLNGDVVRETFMAILAYHPIIGQVFFYSFIALHIYVVLNIIIAVVEESYFITMTKTHAMEERIAEESEKTQLTEERAKAAVREAAMHSKVLAANEAWEKGERRVPVGTSAPAPSSSSGRRVGFQDQEADHGSSGGGASGSGGEGLASDASSPTDGDLGDDVRMLSALPPDLDPLHMPAKSDSNSVKDRGNSRLALLLRLSEWTEIVTGHEVGKPAAGSSAQGKVNSEGDAGSRGRKERRDGEGLTAGLLADQPRSSSASAVLGRTSTTRG
jgi:hypothetical protein